MFMKSGLCLVFLKIHSETTVSPSDNEILSDSCKTMIHVPSDSVFCVGGSFAMTTPSEKKWTGKHHPSLASDSIVSGLHIK